jgi:uncharacterized protein YneF (UPF0154 family)
MFVITKAAVKAIREQFGAKPSDRYVLRIMLHEAG